MAKEKIYTIPVTDAYNEANEACDCPICTMYNKLVRDKIDFILDTAYMEEDFREETNRLGFCEKHYDMLNLESNRLGIILILETHIKQVHKELMKKVNSPVQSKKGFLSKRSGEGSPVSQYIEENLHKCYICETVEITFELYLDTLIYLYKKDPKFKPLFESTNTYCMKHFGVLYDLGLNKLKGPEQAAYLKTITKVYETGTTELVSDIEWFIKKYDYRFKDEPWNNAKTSIPRALKHVASLDVKANQSK